MGVLKPKLGFDFERLIGGSSNYHSIGQVKLNQIKVELQKFIKFGI